MKVLLDTCVILDALQNREPFSQAAQQIFLLAATNTYIGCITAKSSTDIYYLMHRFTHDDAASREVLEKLFTLFDVLDTTGEDCRLAAASPVSDYEDAVMIETAARSGADFIVTRNTHDYQKSRVTVLTPSEFLEMMENT